MAINLLEAYKNRLATSDSVYAKNHFGAKMDTTRKLMVAKCLENTNRFLNEAFENSVGTQRSDMGLFKKFCLNLTTVALPNLIAPDLMLTKPMTSMSGTIAYLQYVYGTNKGATKQGDVYNDPFHIGDVDTNYTSSRVVETATAVTDNGKTVARLAWTPVYVGEDATQNVKITKEDGGTIDALAFTIDAKTGVITFTAGVNANDKVKVAYVYDNVVVPQNDIPLLNARMQDIPVKARARRIAIMYSQMANFQAKTDYGFDLGEALASQAVGELAYEIDTEAVQLLSDTATKEDALTWSRTLPVGVSKTEHYIGFTEVVGLAKSIIYKRTKKFAPNYMVIASDILPILGFVPSFTAAPATDVNGPYFAGTLQGLKVYVSPSIPDGEFFLGVNGNDLLTSAAVFAPYMAIVPTQLLQYADGGTTQGFSTLYDMKILNPLLLVKGEVVD